MYPKERFQTGRLLVIGVLLVTPFAAAQKRTSPPAVVTRYCSGCHGVAGQSQLPFIPRLAGLNSAYMQGRLNSFRTANSPPVDEIIGRISHPGKATGRRGTTAVATVHMVGTAKAVSPKDVAAAAQWYAAQEPARGRDANTKEIENGRSLYTQGLNAQHLSACQSCHGPEAKGTDTAPRLAGQNASYLLGQLVHFRGDEKSASPMTEVARSLETSQARALAAYLQSR